MLTEKDYCDYETCVALKELGFSEPTLAYYHGFLPSKPLLYLVIDEDCMPEYGVNVFDLLSNSNKYKDSKNIDAPTIYEAQKWLRKEKNIEVNASFDKKDDGWIAFIQRLDYPDLCGTDVLSTIYNTYEAALNQSIKEAMNVLKEDGVTKQEIQNE